MSTRVTLIAMLLLSVASATFASTEWNIQCDEALGQFQVTVDIFNQYVQEGDVTGYELLFEQSAVGTCDPPEVFMAVPLHDPLTWAQYTFTRPAPELNVNYRFTVLMRHPDGTVQDVDIPGAPSWSVASCGEAVAVRGFLVDPGYLGYLDVLPCPDSCETWLCSQMVDLSQVPVEQWQPFVGTNIPMDIYGEVVFYPMAGSPCLIGFEVRPTQEGDCAPVATDERTWGSLKAGYR